MYLALSSTTNSVHRKPFFHDVNTCTSCVYQFHPWKKKASYFGNNGSPVPLLLETRLVRARRHDSLLSITPIQLLTDMDLGGVGDVLFLVLVWIPWSLICFLPKVPVPLTKSLSFKLSLKSDGMEMHTKRIQTHLFSFVLNLSTPSSGCLTEVTGNF